MCRRSFYAIQSRVAEDGFVQHICVNLIQNGVLLRNSTSVDDAAHSGSILSHSLQNDTRMESGAFDGGKQLVCSGAGQIPSQKGSPRNIAQRGPNSSRPRSKDVDVSGFVPP